eukprot:gene1335-1682_t
MNNKIYLSILFIILSCSITFVKTQTQEVVIVNHAGTFPYPEAQCGSATSPCINLLDAITRTQTMNNPKIELKPGTYSGSANKEIIIEKPIYITSSSGNNADTIFDCQGIGRLFTISGTMQVTLSGFTAKQCSSDVGGAVFIENGSEVNINNFVFVQNVASLGGAVYVKNSVLQISDVIFQENHADELGGAVYAYNSFIDLFGVTNSFTTGCNYANNEHTSKESQRSDFHAISKTTVTLSHNLLYNQLGMKCDSSSKIIYNGEDVCDRGTSFCQPTTVTPTGCDSAGINCLTDGSCPCHFGGASYETGIREKNSDETFTDKIIEKTSIVSLDIPDIMPGYKGDTIISNIDGFFKVPIDGHYTLLALSSNIGVQLLIDHQHFFNSNFHGQSNQKINSSDSIYLETRSVHRLSIKITGLPVAPTVKRTLQVLWKSPVESEFKPIESLFYSHLICGDGILDYGESSCMEDAGGITPDPTINCGDGICNEKDPNSCFVDCYYKITPVCPVRTIPKGHIAPGFPLGGDTLGNLINNQFVWRLPGSENMEHGVNIINGKPMPNSLFYFGYCHEMATNIVENVYSGFVYDLPKELVGKMYPQCTYSSNSTVYSSTKEMSESMFESFTRSGSGALNIPFLQAEIGAGFTNEKTVETAKSLSNSISTSYIVTNVDCTVSSIEMVEHTFHPEFIKGLKDCNSLEDFYLMIVKYGTHFYRNAVLGGRLSQVTATEDISTQKTSSREWQKSADRSFNLGLSYGALSGSVSYQNSLDSTVSAEQLEDHESKSFRSSIITYGGSLGAYGPTGQYDLPPDYSEWAESVSALPVPIKYGLQPIRSILNKQWKTASGLNIATTWEEAEKLFYLRSIAPNVRNHRRQYSLLFKFNEPTRTDDRIAKYPQFKLNWNIQTYDANKKTFSTVAKSLTMDLFHNNSNIFDLTNLRYGTFNRTIPILNSLIPHRQSLKYFTASPLIHHFESDEDFFNSISAPTYTLTGFDLTGLDIYLIGWGTGKGMVFQATNANPLEATSNNFASIFTSHLYKAFTDATYKTKGIDVNIVKDINDDNIFDKLFSLPASTESIPSYINQQIQSLDATTLMTNNPGLDWSRMMIQNTPTTDKIGSFHYLQGMLVFKPSNMTNTQKWVRNVIGATNPISPDVSVDKWINPCNLWTTECTNANIQTRQYQDLVSIKSLSREDFIFYNYYTFDEQIVYGKTLP